MPSHSLRIAIDGRPALWGRTSTGTMTQSVLERIQSADPHNQYFAWFDSDPRHVAHAYCGLTCHFGGSRNNLVWSNTWALQRLQQDDIDVYVTFLEKEVPLVPTRAKIVSMIHDLSPLRFPGSTFRNPAHRLYYNTLIRASARRSDLILTSSVHSRDEIVSELRVEKTKVHQIPLGVYVNGPDSPARTAAVLQRHRLERPFALALGSTEPRKNNARVLEAMRLIAPSHPGLKLAIAGCAWHGREFDPALLSDRVRLLGHVPDADLPVLMSAAEMLVVPSLYEGFGFPVIEAMALGVPVITSPVTALPEVAGDAALYADPHNPAEIAARMEQILRDPELVALLRTKGRERAERFRWSETCTAIATLCEGLVGKPQWRTQPVTQ